MRTIEPLMPGQTGTDYPRWTEELRDHSHVLIRPVQAQDAAEERTFIEALSPQSRRYRFLGEVRHPSSVMIERLTDIDYVHDLAFAAVVHDDSRDKFVGVARYSTSADGTDCECAVTVLDDWQGKGLGSVLMKHLIDVARSRGVKRMWSIDSAENLAMADLAHHLGFQRIHDPDDAAQVIHSLSL
jgi:GNAT superfamily N-acetyltransferase